MNNNTYTRDDYQKAMAWLTEMKSSDKSWSAGEAAVYRILRSLPEPTEITFADLAEEEWPDYWGCAVEHKKHGRKGWALGRDLDGYITVLVEGEGLPTTLWFPESTTIFPDEPRLHIPGHTPEPTPDHPTTLTTEEDYQDAPAGTVVASGDSPERVWIRGERYGWFEVGKVGFVCSSTMAERGSATVLRWGDGK
ncbi:hypothetical protein [uncultured Corynebacterium sp.]|uniref:hypothetical protein n=1 Tax=uncultured Corynebacterium sp. TaxID=159447 RepID=UPI002599C14E|nr:hypothetical protein [uncultured Corynebacterium sp.]